MLKKLPSIMILLALALSLAIPAGSASANDDSRTTFTGTEGVNHCYDDPPDSRCTPGTLVTLPNGQVMLTNSLNIIDFQTSDPRFTGQIEVNFTFYPSSPHSTHVTGAFRFYPSTIDGYWEGVVAGDLPSAGGVHSKFSAIGYGALKGLMLKGTNTNGLIEGEIIRLGKP